MTSPDPWAALRAHTLARIALGRTGASLPTAEWLRFAEAHALARDAVHTPLDVAALVAALRHHGNTSADFDGFDGIDTHHRVSDIGIETIEYRLTETRRHAASNNRQLRADRVTLFADLPDEIFELLNARGIGTKEGIVVGRMGRYRFEHPVTDLTEVAVDLDP